MSRVKIPVHVFAFGIASVPGIFYAMYWKRNHESDEEFEEKLREKYGSKIQSSKDKRENMVKLIQAIKHPGQDSDQDEKLQEILKGGKQSIKRHYAVDKTLYGTEEGVIQRRRAEEDVTRKKKRKSQKKKNSDDFSTDDDEKDMKSPSTNETNTALSVFTVTAVSGSLAFLVSTILSGRRSQ